MSRVIKFSCYETCDMGETYNMVFSDDYSSICEFFSMVNTDENLRQFTGLTDKNGVDIYEDDVLLVEYNYLGTMAVKFISGAYNIAGYSLDRCQVVGNIHQDPELLLK